MKNLILSALFLSSLSAFAGTPVESCPGLDTSREGDLSQKTIEFFTASNLGPACDFMSIGQDGKEYSDLKAVKLDSFSTVDKFQHNTGYDATYLVTKSCYSGSTQAGAGRTPVAAVIIKANRETPASGQGAVDTFKVQSSIDVNTLTVQF